MALPDSSARRHLYDFDHAPIEQRLAGIPNLHSLTNLQVIFLLRLARLLHERADWPEAIPSTDWRFRLLNKAIYSTFCDCVEQGTAKEARVLFEQHP